MTTTTDRIEKQVLLRAPRARVWRALSDAEEFGTWFQVKWEGAFREGATVCGRLTNPDYEHVPMEITIEKMEAERLLAYRWRPYAIDPKVDYSGEPKTLVEMRLEDAPGGTLLTIVESGFDGIPIARRAEAYRMHDAGWVEQAENLRKYVGG
jgi:uncharacterized protein YndB with AHSA1/START domain